MPWNSTAGTAVALAAAVLWGGGDFSGGMSVKAAGGSTSTALRVVLTANFLSLLVLLAVCRLTHSPVPHGAPLLWGLAGGVTAAISITAFYQALSRGAMGPSAAVSGLLAAAIPAAASASLEGRPGILQLAGFLLAALAIWAIATGEQAREAPGTMRLAVVGGVGFGIYFVALRMANPLGVFEPMALARFAGVITCGLLWLGLARKQSRTSFPPVAWAWTAGVAVLDTGGNLLFVAATRMGRLDAAAVLASLYPASTILLAAWKLHERPTPKQWAGMALALIAVVMIAL